MSILIAHLVPTQVMLGQLPLLMHANPRNVLVIGLGSGITVGSTATHATVDRLDVLEISPEVVAASRFFTAENGDVLSDPRLNLIVADARNFMLANVRRYDVITSEPSNPWVSGISNLFTRDFFDMARTRLTDGGLMAQWLQTYSMAIDDVKTVLHTFQAAFPHVSVWVPMKGDLILIGSEKPHVMDYIQLEEALIRPDVSEDLSRVGMQTPAKLFRKFLIGGAELSNYTAGARLNTDDRPIIEFNAPRNLYAATSHTNQVSIVQHLGGAELAVPVVKMAEATSDGLTATALELVVRTTPVLAEGDWQASWLVERQLIPAQKEGASRVVAASRAMLTWQEEGATENQVSAFHLPVRPKAEEQQALLRWLAGRPIRGGKITMPGGRKGTWLMASGKQTGLHVLAITWGRPSESGFYIQYVAMRTQQNPIKGVWESTLLGLAKRFRPIGVAKK